LLAEQPGHDPVDVHSEVDADRDGPPVDARLDLAGEERLPGVLPSAVLTHQRDRLPDRLGIGVDAEIAQQRHGGEGSGPGLPLGEVAPEVRRETRATRPLAIVAAQGEQPGAPPLGRDTRPLLGHHLS
jgi:hypothetical protein